MARYYENQNPKKVMKQASAMIHEDKSAPCLLPQGVIEKVYPSNMYSLGGVPGDLYNGVQIQLSEDGSDMRRENKPKKY